jgi:hypothetical protein
MQTGPLTDDSRNSSLSEPGQRNFACGLRIQTATPEYVAQTSIATAWSRLKRCCSIREVSRGGAPPQSKNQQRGTRAERFEAVLHIEFALLTDPRRESPCARSFTTPLVVTGSR